MQSSGFVIIVPIGLVLIINFKLKQIKFKNQHRQQELNKVIFSDIECYMKGTDEEIGSKT